MSGLFQSMERVVSNDYSALMIARASPSLAHPKQRAANGSDIRASDESSGAPKGGVLSRRWRWGLGGCGGDGVASIFLFIFFCTGAFRAKRREIG